MSEICVIGSFVMDMCASVDQFPEPGQTVIAKHIRFAPGGKGCNQCVAVARLHGDCEMIGVLGDDAYGKTFLEVLTNEHIKHDQVWVQKQVPTGFSQIQLDAHAENKIVVIPGANYAFTPDRIGKIQERILESRLVVLQMELPKETLLALLDFCHQHQKSVLLNPAPASGLPDAYFEKITYLTPNETELSILSQLPCDTQEQLIIALSSLFQKGVKHIIATLGSKGCAIMDENGVRFIEGYHVDVVDTVAAGDAFNGALALGLVKGESLDTCVVLANAVGALAVTKQGAIPSLPTLEEVEKFMKEQN